MYRRCGHEHCPISYFLRVCLERKIVLGRIVENHLVCPLCGKAGEVHGNWVRPSVASGDLITGLDVENCAGCWDTMARSGIAPGFSRRTGTAGMSSRLYLVLRQSIRTLQPFSVVATAR